MITNRQALPKNERGAAMLAALCLAMVFAISLSSYIALCYTSLKMSTRSAMSSHSLELAETGLEQALYAQNNSDWTGWTLAGGNATAAMTMTTAGLVATNTSPTPLNFGSGTTGRVNLTVANYGTSNASFTSQGVFQMPDGAGVVSVSRTLTFGGVAAPKTALAPIFVNAVAATSGRVRFNAAGTVDSFNSDPGTGYQAYPGLGAGASAVVLSKNIVSGTSTVRLTNAVVHGYAVGYYSLNSASTNWLSYGASGKVIGPSTPNAIFIDSSRLVTTPVQYQPVVAENLPNGPLLPSACCVGSSNILSQASTLGLISGSPLVIYDASGINLSSAILTIQGPVVLVVYGNISISGTGGIQLTTPQASLQIFAENGSVTIGGLGITNTSAIPLAKRVSILSTNSSNTGGYPVNFQTNNPFYGVIYFPYQYITVSSATPTITGSIVGYSVTFTTSPTFHYDVALRHPDSTLGDAAFAYLTSPTTVSGLVATVP